ncbi:acyl-CoA carboxylase epsilon subunit, partial [Streptomyces sp. NPDC048193]|uniref:acyl-CoA carboxylase epsilon subunit n=1 Tax=Streptomyces sp. NPDC048193 TaxID=3155630 RepID=UPI003448A8A4
MSGESAAGDATPVLRVVRGEPDAAELAALLAALAGRGVPGAAEAGAPQARQAPARPATWRQDRGEP